MDVFCIQIYQIQYLISSPFYLRIVDYDSYIQIYEVQYRISIPFYYYSKIFFFFVLLSVSVEESWSVAIVPELY